MSTASRMKEKMPELWKEFEEQEKAMAVKVSCAYLRNAGFTRAEAIEILHRAEEQILKEILEGEKEDEQ